MGMGIVVGTIVGGGGLPVSITVAVVVVSGTMRVGFGSGIVMILVGSPRSMTTSPADEGFSTLMENVLVAVAEEVWKVTTARPSVSVVSSA